MSATLTAMMAVCGGGGGVPHQMYQSIDTFTVDMTALVHDSSRLFMEDFPFTLYTHAYILVDVDVRVFVVVVVFVLILYR